ncbi:conserved hypothetical protein [Burkholderia vietnamiensis]|nr:conserved hypothetical protein [Burkholderia vietnamiensis]
MSPGAFERLSRDTVAAFFHAARRAANCARRCDSIVSTGRKPGRRTPAGGAAQTDTRIA